MRGGENRILCGLLNVIDGLFFLSTFLKIPHGTFWSFFIAAVLMK
jgi:K+ transporter